MLKFFCRCNAAVSDLYDGKSKNKIAVVFFFLIPMGEPRIAWKVQGTGQKVRDSESSR